MNQQARIFQLENIQKDGSITTKKIWYQDRESWFDVYQIPLEYLMYNPYNGRIMSLVKTFEKQFHEIDLNSEEDKLLIERFIWDSSPDYNKHTLESLRKYGQNEIGIVTRDGIIIDGNRRACLLNYLNKQDGLNRPFIAVILPDILEGNKRQIGALETLYQIGVDDKVDYNPIEKYLKCKDLKDDGFDISEIAKLMSEDTKSIVTFLGILALMEEYLDRIDYNGIYTKLSKREGHFVDLFNYINSYSKSWKSQNVDWDYSDEDIQTLKLIYFDYIRLGLPVATCRVIGRSKKSESFFCNGAIWAPFKEKHEGLFEGSNELTLNEFKETFGGEDINAVIANREEYWTVKFKDRLIYYLEDTNRILDDKRSSKHPIELLKRAYNSLNQTNVESLDPALIDSANQLVTQIKEKVEEIGKNISVLIK